MLGSSHLQLPWGVLYVKCLQKTWLEAAHPPEEQQGSHRDLIPEVIEGVELLASSTEDPMCLVAMGCSLGNSFVWLGPLWLMASESGSPGHLCTLQYS